MLHIFLVNKIIFEQYLRLHKHPDTFIQTCDAMTQTDHTTIRQKPIFENSSNRMRTTLSKRKIAYPTGQRMIMIPPAMMNLKHFSTNILHTRLTLTSHFEAIIHQEIPIATAHHQLPGPLPINIDHLRRLP